MTKIDSGIWKITFGIPEGYTPVNLNPENMKTEALGKMTEVSREPFVLEDINFRASERGCVVEIPMDEDEQIYGFGMRLPSFNATGTRKSIVVTDLKLLNQVQNQSIERPI